MMLEDSMENNSIPSDNIATCTHIVRSLANIT